MKKNFKLEGLDCLSCASKIERDIGGLDGVNSICVNFFTQKLVIDAEESKMDSIIKAAKKIIKKIEPDTTLKKA